MRLTSLVLLLALATSAQAAPHWYSSPKWWAGTAIIGTVAALDGISSQRAYNRGYIEGGWDAAPIIGQHPSRGALAGYCAGEFALGTTLHWGFWRLTHNDRSKAWRTLGDWAAPDIFAGYGLPVVVNNFKAK